VRTADGNEYRSWAVLLAMGSTYRRLEVPGEEDFIGAGVHFCATCDGAFYRDKDVLVIGGGNSAGEEGIFLTKFARKVTIVTRDAKLSASKVIVEKVESHPKIDVLAGYAPVEFTGNGKLERVSLKSTETGEIKTVAANGVFVFIGLTPNTGIVQGQVDLDECGFVVADMGLQTSMPGVFVAGDCREGSTKQAASAAGEGAAAALSIRRYIEPLASGMPSQAEMEKEMAAAGA
jgi:thioredoxin reductase (NADPH)